MWVLITVVLKLSESGKFVPVYENAILHKTIESCEVNMEKVYHGISTSVTISESDILFKDLPKKFEIGRYHSWVVATPLPNELIATSFDDEGHLMSLRHKTYDVRSVQYHPESVLTPNGKKILENWIKS